MVAAVRSALYPASAVVLAVDPGDTTGLAVRAVDGGELLGHMTVKIDRKGWTQRDAIDRLGDLIGPVDDRRWMAAVEHAVPLRRGAGAPPAHAERYWLDVIDLWARERQEIATPGKRFRVPTIARPHASDWRAPLGIRTRSILGKSATHDQRRFDLKSCALKWLELTEGVRIASFDEAEAACLAAWCVRIAHTGQARVGKTFRPITWSP